jgi:YVTN family beta-propeller protein
MKRLSVALVLLVFCLAAQPVLAAPYAYITQVGLGALTVFDTVKNKKVATIDVGGNGRSPFAIAMSPDGRKAYVASQAWLGTLSPMVYVIDVLDHSVTATIPVGAFPIGIAILPNGTKLYVAGYTGPVPGGLPGITIIDTASNNVETTIAFGEFPFAVAAHPDSSKVYVTDSDNSTVTVIDTASQTISQTVTVGTSPEGIAVHPDGTRVYVANEESNNISVIDTSSNNVTETISLPGRPNQVVFNPTGTRAYVTSEEGSNMWVIDTSSRTVIATVDVGPGSCGVDVTPDGAYVYVVTESYDDVKDKPFNHGVKVIDAATNAVKKKIKLSGQPYSMGKFIGGPQFLMTVSTAGLGTGKVISKKLPDIDCGSGGIKCEADFYVNRKVQLQAVPDEGSVLTGWSGACTKKSKTCKLVITDDYSVTATFEPK